MNGFAFAAAITLFLGGIVLFAFAFETKGFETIMFVGGIAAITASLVIPFHVMKRTDA